MKVQHFKDFKAKKGVIIENMNDKKQKVFKIRFNMWQCKYKK